LMGKFTQSVRRIVQDVKDEGTLSGLSREEVIDINERLRLFRVRLEDSYETAKKALNALMAKYGDSKSQRNIFHRYPLLKIMIKVGMVWHFTAVPCGLISCLDCPNRTLTKKLTLNCRRLSNWKHNTGRSWKSPNRKNKKLCRLSCCVHVRLWRRRKSPKSRLPRSWLKKRPRRKSDWIDWTA